MLEINFDVANATSSKDLGDLVAFSQAETSEFQRRQRNTCAELVSTAGLRSEELVHVTLRVSNEARGSHFHRNVIERA